MPPISDTQLQFDKQHIWHPYTSLTSPTPVLPVESAQGVYLNLRSGQKLIDGMASWWSTIHGYNHPQINEAAKKQIDKMSHVMFGGLTHEPAIQLAQTLVEITAKPLEAVFLADSGSVSVEVALKMALQYWHAKGQPKKSKFLTFRNGYHGDTFGAMAVCDPENGMHSMFSRVLPQHIFVNAPLCQKDQDWQSSDINDFEQALKANHQQIAAVIIEPIVQGAGGMRVYAAEYLRQIRKLCDDYQVLLILDEIATGFGRTGTLFAYEQAEICPDILCLGKALTGGYMSLAATLTTQKVAQVIGSYAGGNLMHGPTFMGNPLACAVANQSLALLLASDWQIKVKQIEAQLLTELLPLAQLDSVKEVRVKGAIGVLELKNSVDLAKLQPKLLKWGVWLRPFGKLVYIMPAYIIKSNELSQLTFAMAEIAKTQQ